MKASAHTIGAFEAKNTFSDLLDQGCPPTAKCIDYTKAKSKPASRTAPEGVRLKHYAAGNSIKVYDKHGQVLRVETTLNHPEAFRVYRTPEGPAAAGG
jgi:hypothetical protein